MANSPESISSRLRQEKNYGSMDTKDAAAFESASTSEDSGSGEEFEDIATNPFLNPDVAAHWRQVYEEAEYECRHVFDSTLVWTEREEKAVIRKVDWRICGWAVRDIPPYVSIHEGGQADQNSRH
jgi:hypothetical protein